MAVKKGPTNRAAASFGDVLGCAPSNWKNAAVRVQLGDFVQKRPIFGSSIGKKARQRPFRAPSSTRRSSEARIVTPPCVVAGMALADSPCRSRACDRAVGDLPVF